MSKPGVKELIDDARAAQARGKGSEALALLRRALDDHKRNRWLLLEIARVLRARRKTRAALAALAEIEDRHDSCAGAKYHLLGEIRQEAGEHESAADAYLESASRFDRAELQWQRFLQSYSKLSETAREALDIRLAGIPDDRPDVRLAKLKILVDRGRTADAVLRLRSWEGAPPVPQDVRLALADKLVLKRHLDEAAEVLGPLLSVEDPPLKASLLDIDMDLLKADAGVAREKAARLRLRHASSPWPVIAAAKAELAEGRFRNALNLLLRARTGESRPEIDLMLADVLRRVGRRDECKRLLDDVKARSGGSSWHSSIELAMFGRGPAWALRAALANAHPGLSEATRRLYSAKLTEMDGSRDRAEQEIASLVASDPDQPNHWHELARIKLAGLDPQGAKTCLATFTDVRYRSGRSSTRINPSQTFLGDLLNEYLIDQHDDPGQSAEGLSPETQRLMLADALLRKPGSTLLAIRLLRACQFPRPTEPADPVPRGDAAQPETIFQYWSEGAPPDDVADVMTSWRALNPEFLVEVYDRHRAAELISSTHGARAARAFQRLNNPAQEADVFRLVALARFGGVYADVDDRCLRPIREWRVPGAELGAYVEDLGSVGNSIMYAYRNAAILEGAVEIAIEAIGSDRCSPWLATGPGLLTRSVSSTYARCLLERLPPPKFQLPSYDELSQHVALHSEVFYKTTTVHWRSRELQDKRARA
jgi:predicted Zn-dependent protease